MISFYLAARFGRRAELNIYAQQLRERGYEITSRWLTQHQAIDLHSKDAKYSDRERLMFALHDTEDVIRANRLIAFTEDPYGDPTVGGRRGGRHVELGMSIISGKHTYVVGYRENVFCHLPQVMFFETFNQLLETL